MEFEFLDEDIYDSFPWLRVIGVGAVGANA